MTNKYRCIFFILLLFLCGALLSCQSSKTPLQVSEHFWLGVKTKNVALVKKYSLVVSIDKSEELDQFENITVITFGRRIIDGNLAEVETNVTMSSNEKIRTITLNTYLENNNDAWKVNYRKTVFQLVVKQDMAKIFDDLQEMTEDISAEIKESVEKIKGKIVPKVRSKIEQAEKELLEKLPEFKNIFDEFLHELGKSLEELMSPEKESGKEVKTQET